MARQRMSERNVRKLANKLGLPIIKVLVRGGTNHRKDLILENGKRFYLWPWGEIEDAEEVDCRPIPVKDPSIPDECRF